VCVCVCVRVCVRAHVGGWVGVCVCVSIYIYINIHIKVLQKCLNLYAYILALRNAPLCPYIRVFKDPPLHMLKLSIPYMPLSICLCGSKNIALSLCL